MLKRLNLSHVFNCANFLPFLQNSAFGNRIGIRKSRRFCLLLRSIVLLRICHATPYVPTPEPKRRPSHSSNSPPVFLPLFRPPLPWHHFAPWGRSNGQVGGKEKATISSSFKRRLGFNPFPFSRWWIFPLFKKWMPDAQIISLPLSLATTGRCLDDFFPRGGVFLPLGNSFHCSGRG